MNHFFVLGNHPELSNAELAACFDFKKSKSLGEVLVGEVDLPQAEIAIARLGGTIKIGRLIAKSSKDQLYAVVLPELLKIARPGKFHFGISLYGKSSLNTYRFGLTLKNDLKKHGLSCRLVTSKEKTLSSVVVEQNKLLRNGCEIVLIADGQSILFGITEAVQPFKELSRRDYGRPARDDYSGMLPPKLAQIMINLSRSRKDEIILDPFCGSGTIVTEAMLMGYESIFGSDISKKAIDDSQKNIEWFKQTFNFSVSPKLEVRDALLIDQAFRVNSLGGIITETYLGPQRGKVDIEKVSQELGQLYSKFLAVAAPLLKAHRRLVIALPAFLSGKKLISVQLPGSLIKKDLFLYGRENQRVFRQILVLEKK